MANEPLITVVGNLGADPESKKTPNGTSVTSFSIANTPRKQKNGEWVDGDPTWFRCFAWGYDASSAATLKKGDKVIVTGRFQVSVYTDKEGLEKKSLEINTDSVGVIPRAVAEPTARVDIRSDEDPIDNFPW